MIASPRQPAPGLTIVVPRRRSAGRRRAGGRSRSSAVRSRSAPGRRAVRACSGRSGSGRARRYSSCGRRRRHRLRRRHRRRCDRGAGRRCPARCGAGAVGRAHAQAAVAGLAPNDEIAGQVPRNGLTGHAHRDRLRGTRQRHAGEHDQGRQGDRWASHQEENGREGQGCVRERTRVWWFCRVERAIRALGDGLISSRLSGGRAGGLAAPARSGRASARPDREAPPSTSSIATVGSASC